MTGYMIKIPAPYPSRNKLNQLMKVQHARPFRQWKSDFQLLTRSAIHKVQMKPMKVIDLRVIIYFKTRRKRDYDNYDLKYLIDCFVQTKIIKDDNPDYVPHRPSLKFITDKHHEERTEVYVTEIENRRREVEKD